MSRTRSKFASPEGLAPEQRRGVPVPVMRIGGCADGDGQDRDGGAGVVMATTVLSGQRW